MNEVIYLETAPVNEECVQAGTEDYEQRARSECKVWINQLKRSFPIPEELEGRCFYRIKRNDHDLGDYFEVELHFNSDNEAALQYVNQVENNCPAQWDDDAREELRQLLSQAAIK